ncbi:SWIM zinc finger family protein [Haladaptatus sp. AB618]|uniref:SWIM zinc finger family protein n=1 Tax=Haladaptatus sp. AB618 TaxID=2934173 RepID=UPI00209BEC75|nr:SWIM zinc finger family protein [Haladaptatus sp. AB618]MCO8256581.1 SWIM zinc finger family protein [Haladaptatus sp. AB618]
MTHPSGLIDVIIGGNEHPADNHYRTSIDDVTHELMACTCPHHVHRTAVENATDDGTLEAFSSEDKDDADPAECDCDDLNGFPC